MPPTYPVPSNGTNRGIHWTASTDHSVTLSQLQYWIDQLLAMNIRWVKLLDNGSLSSKALCEALIRAGILPIVRLYRPRPNPHLLSTLSSTVPRNPLCLAASNIDTVRALVDVGVRYFEPNNEPNQEVEWDSALWYSADLETKARWVAVNWLADAEKIIKAGGLPAFPALAPCGHTKEVGSVLWYEAMFKALWPYSTVVHGLFDAGAWLALHLSPLNHCYKDKTGQWHFEYPNDPVCQADKPGLTVYQDDSSLIGFQVPQKILRDRFGVDPVIISTEGGVFVPDNGVEQWDSRYPAIDYAGHAAATVAMFAWLKANCPEVLAMCPWLIANERLGHNDPSWTPDAWYRKDWILPVVAAMMKDQGNVGPVEPTPELEEVVRNAAWNAHGIAYNPNAAFPVFARENHLGAPLTGEIDVQWKGKTYRLQAFTGGILYCEVGDWSNIHILSW